MTQKFKYSEISIHAAREGGDDCRALVHAQHIPFQSTPPVKAATGDIKFLRRKLIFQSTPPVKAATASNAKACCKRLISIHAAREGGDVRNNKLSVIRNHFNPRRP